MSAAGWRERRKVEVRTQSAASGRLAIQQARRRQVRRRLHQLVAMLYLCAVLGSIAMVAGPWMNDRAIAADQGRSLATVVSINRWRTTVEYRDAQGELHSPKTGLLYPTGLGEGQRVWVNYSRKDPNVVKVEGRRWTLALLPALSTVVIATLLAGAAWFAVSRKIGAA